MVQLIFASFYLSHSGNRLFYLISLLFNGKFLRCTSLIKLVLFVSSLFLFFLVLMLLGLLVFLNLNSDLTFLRSIRNWVFASSFVVLSSNLNFRYPLAPILFSLTTYPPLSLLFHALVSWKISVYWIIGCAYLELVCFLSKRIAVTCSRFG